MTDTTTPPEAHLNRPLAAASPGPSHGTRRRGSSGQPRHLNFKIRFNKTEYESIREASDRHGLAPRAWAGEMLLRCAAGELPPPLASWQNVLAAQLAHRVDIVRAGTVINQVAKVANSTGRVPLAVERLAELSNRMLTRADALIAAAVARKSPGDAQ